MNHCIDKRINQPTNQPTNQLTNQPTDQPSFQLIPARGPLKHTLFSSSVCAESAWFVWSAHTAAAESAQTATHVAGTQATDTHARTHARARKSQTARAPRKPTGADGGTDLKVAAGLLSEHSDLVHEVASDDGAVWVGRVVPQDPLRSIVSERAAAGTILSHVHSSRISANTR